MPSIGTPVFYINSLEFAVKSGAITSLAENFYTLPVIPRYVGLSSNNNDLQVDSIIDKLTHDQTGSDKVIFFLGHDMAGRQFILHGNGVEWRSPIVNDPINVAYDGFSVGKYTGNLESISCDGYIGSIVIGNSYTMPNSPNLSLSMVVEYGEKNEITTYNGGSISNVMAIKPPNWGFLSSWELNHLNDEQTYATDIDGGAVNGDVNGNVNGSGNGTNGNGDTEPEDGYDPTISYQLQGGGQGNLLNNSDAVCINGTEEGTSLNYVTWNNQVGELAYR